MRVLVAVAIIVFVGILDDSLARKLTLRKVRLIVENINRNPNSPRLTPADATAHRWTPRTEDDSGSCEEIAEECAQNGGPNACVDVKTKIKSAIMELEIGLGINESLSMAMERVAEEESFDPFVRYFCQRKNVLQTFATSYANAIKTCFDAETRSVIDALANVPDNLTKYLCQESGNKISEFFHSNGLGCIAGRQVALESCLVDSIPRFDNNASEVNKMDMEDADCTYIAAARNCIQAGLKQCADSRHADFFVGSFDFFLSQLC